MRAFRAAHSDLHGAHRPWIYNVSQVNNTRTGGDGAALLAHCMS
jgi:hypothetical protein